MSGVYLITIFFFFNKEVVKQLLGEDSTGTVLSHKEAWQTKANDV